MKKLLCLLAAVLLCTMFIVPALGEGCYEGVKAMFSDAEILGAPKFSTPVNDKSLESKEVWIMFDYTTDDKSICIFGFNSKGVYELTYWDTPGQNETLALFGALCSTWDGIEDLCDPGYSIVLALDITDEESDTIFVTDASEAAAVTEIFDNL